MLRLGHGHDLELVMMNHCALKFNHIHYTSAKCPQGQSVCLIFMLEVLILPDPTPAPHQVNIIVVVVVAVVKS